MRVVLPYIATAAGGRSILMPILDRKRYICKVCG
jgi:hypothetical protein